MRKIKVNNIKIINMFLRMLGFILSVGILIMTISDGARLTIKEILYCFIALYIMFGLVGITGFGNRFFLTSYFWFLFFFLCYQAVYPIVTYFGGVTFFSVSLSSVTYTFLYALKFLCCVLFVYFLFYKKFGPPQEIYRIVDVSQTSGNYNGLVLVAAFNLVLEIYSFIFGGNLAYILSGSTSRVDINNYISTTNVWGFVAYINIYLFVIWVLQKKRGKKNQSTILIAFDIIFYFIISLLTGSRKFVLYIMIVMVMFYIAKIFKSKLPLVGGALIVLVATYQRIWVFDGGIRGDFFHKMAGMFGEFIFPTITFPLSYQLGIGLSMFNYYTYFDSILYFIPRKIFAGKNYSIGTIFERYMNVGMGFAANPLLEGYINCGKIGWLIEALFIIVILYLVTKFSKKNFVLFIFGIIFLVDLNRGEVSYFFRRIIEMWVMISVANYLSKKIRIKI